ncbi:MAG: methionine ABC transporter substrate-binding lipoprotein MetQ [Chthoniobacterales bacterium]
MKLFTQLITASFLIVATFTGCHAKKQKNLIKVGVSAGREADLMETVAKIAKEKYDLTVVAIPFSDYATPNVALNDGSLDVNAFQHKPYLEAQNHDRGFHLVVVGNTFVYPIAGYAKKIKQLSELSDRAKVAIPNDPTNLGRALLLLQKEGLITLKPDIDLEPTALDIVGNPKNLQIIELEAAQIPRSFEDVDLAIINSTYAAEINLLPTRDGLFVEEKDSPYVNIIAARQENKDEKKIQDFVKAYQTEEVFQKANKLFEGNVVKGW